ncbi:RNA methyltransferase [Bacteroides sp. 214]|uniref:TrmH family RNA methyltransferase n=1 Tax=Bacteroides sp. 214 TaxID=2302935 RepID=UPI0013D7651A|nr:RNA methyltransferase [Bacteroides sp. 214]NDW12924.1 RNA methyltransferase [Bacteroides sp. 214]
MSLSKNKIKYLRSLELKKNRKEEKVFLAEGPKLIEELQENFHCLFLAATKEWLHSHAIQADEIVEVTQEELTKASLLKTPQQVLAVFKQPEYTIDKESIRNSLSLVLDDIQDPGNLGTIIRLADWFGIEHIFCSLNTTDVYNPKSIQATMGGIARVKMHYLPLKEFIQSLGDIPVYGTFLNGKNMYTESLSNNGLIIMGNEGNGISKDLEEIVTNKLYIPNYPPEKPSTESLNVATATAIVCAEFRRREY